MATEAGELVVKLRADIQDLSQNMRSATDVVGKFGVSTIAIGTALGVSFNQLAQKALDFGISSVKAFGDQEIAITRLTNIVGQDAAMAFRNYAQEVQRTTTFSDDSVLSLEAQLASFGVLPGSIEEATHALVEYAAQTGKDLPEAGSVLARAMAGQSRELKQYGLELSATDTRSDNLAKTTKFLEGRFGDIAEQLRGTTIGQVESLKNKFDDLKKQLGEQLLPVANKVLQWAVNMMEPLSHLNDKHKTYSDTISDQKQKLADLTYTAKAYLTNGLDTLPPVLTAAIRATGEHIKTLEKATAAHKTNKGAIENEIDAIRKLKEQISGEAQIYAHINEVAKYSTDLKIAQAQNELAIIKATQSQISTITNLETEKRLATTKLSYEANASFSDQLKVKMAENMAHSTSVWVDMTNTMIDSFSASTAQMIMEGGRFSMVIQQMWKQLAQMVIQQIIRMIAQWLVWQAMTGGAGGAFHGFMAEGGMINEPSLIIGMKSGNKHIAGEAGPEMVVPAGGGGNFAFSSTGGPKGGGSGGGSEIHIHINGQFLEGSPSKWQEVVKRQIVPEIRRWTMSSPTGPFQRRRGSAG